MFGMPIGIKDNIVTKGLRTTCASKMLENFDPIDNATVMDKLEAANMVTIGKLTWTNSPWVRQRKLHILRNEKPVEFGQGSRRLFRRFCGCRRFR